MSLDGAIWFIPKSDKITTELEFNYDASETYDAKKNVEQVQNVKPGARVEVPATPKFSDVPADSPFADAIDWAVAEGITNGTTATTFGPGSTCSISNIITFLWRANGKPGAVEGTSDRDSAAKWAVEQKLIAEDEDISAPCTRVMAVAYMWRVAGNPEAGSEISFTDVDKEADYAGAVAWAVDQKITAGTSETTFSPDKTCTRGQIATFLYRAANAFSASAEKAEASK